MSDLLWTPFPYFGTKHAIADVVWERLGNVDSYVEPCCGSCAVLLGRPSPGRFETVNDVDGLLVNALRGLKHEPTNVAEWANHEIWEPDLHAAHAWLVQEKAGLVSKLEADLEYHDAKMAGLWIWGMCTYIGAGFCSGEGPWHVQDGKMVKGAEPGLGINKKLPGLGGERGANTAHLDEKLRWFAALSKRFKNVRIACGDWSRVVGPTITWQLGVCGVVIDPPYEDFTGVYNEANNIVTEINQWANESGNNPLMRIVLCGYEGEYNLPDTWDCVSWTAHHGYGAQRTDGTKNENKTKERIWFSPHCLKPQPELFKL